MEYNTDKVDEITLALMHLTSFNSGYGERTWKNFDWDVLNRLHEKGFIRDPKSKAKSVAFTKEGAEKSAGLFKELFGLEEEQK